MLTPNEIEAAAERARSTHEALSQLEYDSQTDVETIVRAYRTGNPDWNENVASKVKAQYIQWILI